MAPQSLKRMYIDSKSYVKCFNYFDLVQMKDVKGAVGCRRAARLLYLESATFSSRGLQVHQRLGVCH